MAKYDILFIYVCVWNYVERRKNDLITTIPVKYDSEYEEKKNQNSKYFILITSYELYCKMRYFFYLLLNIARDRASLTSLGIKFHKEGPWKATDWRCDNTNLWKAEL